MRGVRTLRKLTSLAAACGLAIGSITWTDARAQPDDPEYKIVVHPDNPITAVGREFLQDAFLKRTRGWSQGRAIRPIDLSTRYSARARFTHEVLKKTPSQLRNYWNQQIFSGKGVPPPESDSVAAVVAFVLAYPGAVGYLPASADPGRAKVVQVR